MPLSRPGPRATGIRASTASSKTSARWRRAISCAAFRSDSARVVVDLGCGPGNSAELLVSRFAGAKVTGLDTSEGMLAAARERVPAARFVKADIADWAPEEAPDLIFANAALQFLPDHHTLFPRLIAGLAPGGVLAAQMPSTARESSHALMRMIAAEGPWSPRLLPIAKTRPVISEFEDYYRWLRPAASRIEIWMTTYVHVFDGADGVADWFAGSGLRPYLELCRTTSAASSSPATATGSARPIPFSRTARSCSPIRGCSSSRPGREGPTLRGASLAMTDGGSSGQAQLYVTTSSKESTPNEQTKPSVHMRARCASCPGRLVAPALSGIERGAGTL